MLLEVFININTKLKRAIMAVTVYEGVAYPRRNGIASALRNGVARAKDNGVSAPRSVSPINILFPSNAVFDLDATIANSYTSGQVWKNIVPTPADGAAQSAYDFNRGAGNSSSTDDPTFVGGVGSPSAYWLLDGGDFFRLAGAVANTPLLNNSPQKQDHTLIMTVNFNTGASQDIGLFSTCDTSNASNRGISYYGGYNFLFLRQRTASGLVSTQSGAIGNSNIPAIVIITYNSATNQHIRWVNTATGTTFAAGWNATAETHVGVLPTIGARGSAVAMPNGSRIYGCAMLNKAINNADAANIISFYNARHRRVYA